MDTIVTKPVPDAATVATNPAPEVARPVLAIENIKETVLRGLHEYLSLIHI